ncbi:MAG TPA: DUF3368 domain-containing protein [Phycisphaerae bacterium]|nr:DUF3368 domain-containing protein [Phycisphaerae bacterium]
MIVVSDASPLNYLVRIRAERLLPALFESVFVPPAVVSELSDARTPISVREFVANPPNWLHVQGPARVDSSIPLDPGELEAIALAEELSATLLIDERVGRRIARSRGLIVTGTLGVLELGAERGLISLPDAVRELRQTDYRISEAIIKGAIQRDEHRRRRP